MMFRRIGLPSRVPSSALFFLLAALATSLMLLWSHVLTSPRVVGNSLPTEVEQNCSNFCSKIFNNAADNLEVPEQLDFSPCSHEPINFESPRPNSLTGPRLTPLKKGAKSLVVIAVGERGKETVTSIIRAFGFDNFTFMLFHYDSSTWSDIDWYDNVIAIRYPKQMKWWYVKRFVSPQIAESYEYIFAIDEDSGMQYMNVSKFVEILRTHNISIAQAAMHETSSFFSHTLTKQVKHTDPSIVGRWTDFAECGPFVSFSREAYTGCIWDLIQEDLSSGWGLDLHWHNYCKQRIGKEATAIIDKYPQVHLSLGTASQRGSDPTKPTYDPGAENAAYSQRFPNIKSTSMKALGDVRMP